ncbi:MAG TPA: lipid-binding SYLF domain-containing protein [Gemmatimonadaceae bacterium]
MSQRTQWLRLSTRVLPALIFLSQFFTSTALGAQDDKLTKRVERAAEVLTELVSVPDKAPPSALLSEATCVAVVPGVVQVGLGFGGRAGYGLASCRTGTGWSLPTFVGLKGGSFGLQIGGQSADVVLVFVNKDAGRLASSTFNLGGGASVAAGPLGRNVSAETDYRLKSEIYSYSKSKGLFAGVDVSGTKWELDYSANRKAYPKADDMPRGDDAKSVTALLSTDGAKAPEIFRPFLQSLVKNIGEGTVK